VNISQLWNALPIDLRIENHLFNLLNKQCGNVFLAGIVNRTFENRAQSNSIELSPWIEFDWVRQSNEIEHHTFSEFDFRTNRIQSNKSNSIELNPSDCVRLSSETELNRTQLNGFRSIGSGEPIQSKPVKASFSRAFFTIYSITQTPFINCPRQLREHAEQNKTKLSLCPRASFEIVVPFPFFSWLTIAARQLEGLLLGKNTSKLLTATQATA